MDKLGESWDDAVFVSNHGRYVNIISLIRDNSKVCTLLGSGHDISDICKKLVYYGMDEVQVTIGEKLSYPSEKITSGKPEDFIDVEFHSLSVGFFRNNSPRKAGVTAGIKDSEFIRAGEADHKVPMTKEEIRLISVSKLCLDKTSVIYDIGAGTGSVSVEMALLAGEGIVYSVEMKQEAVSLLEQNKKKFRVDNMEIISGEAPDVIRDLPAPTHVFIGGSSGRLRAIVDAVREKNPLARFVVTAVTLETVVELNELADEYEDSFEMIQISASRSRKLGAYHMLSAENPVYIAAFGGE
jgi:precorrin-6Y C5,15-methyltransferase (decarboxylating)